MAESNLEAYSVRLKLNIHYIVIDPLYVRDIKDWISDLNHNNIFEDIRIKIFPHCDTPFTNFTAFKEIVTLDNIKKIESHQVAVNLNVVSVDTGMLLFISQAIFLEFVSRCDYDELTAFVSEPTNSEYWYAIEAYFGEGNVGLIVSPGIASGFEFDGSGVYTIANEPC